MIIKLGTCKMMAESAPIGDGDPRDPSLFEVKESATGGGKSIWDEEW